MKSRLRNFVRANLILIATFSVALAIFAFAFATTPERPGVTTPNGYQGFYDQSQYLNEAKILASGHLPNRGTYFYPLGYPILGAISLKLFKGHDPFLVPDALLFASTITLLVAFGHRFRSWAFGFGCAALVVLASPLLRQTTIPWSTTLSAFGVMACLVLVSGNKFSLKHGLVFGAVTALVFAARFQDGAMVALFGLYPLAKYRKKAVMPLMIGALIALTVTAGVMYSQDRAFGTPFKTPYSQHYGLTNSISDQSLSAYKLRSIPSHFVEMFLTANDSRGRRQPGTPLVVESFWLLLTPLGVVALFLRKQKFKAQLSLAFGLSVLSTGFYLSFRSSDGGGIKFGLLHYFKEWLPIWSVLAGIASVWILDKVNSTVDHNSHPSVS